MKKYVSSTLAATKWNTSVIVRGDVTAQVSKLRQQEGGDLLVYGHGLLVETLLRGQLLDLLDISIHPITAGSGRLPFREGQHLVMKLTAMKGFQR